MQGILKPLDALMELTFKEIPDVGAQQVALEVGNDDPYNDGHGIQEVKLIGDYKYPCHGADTLINYCEIFPGALPPESGFDRIITNTSKIILRGCSEKKSIQLKDAFDLVQESVSKLSAKR